MKRSEPPRLESEAVPGADGGGGGGGGRCPGPASDWLEEIKRSRAAKFRPIAGGKSADEKVIVLPFQIELVELKVQHLVGLLQPPPPNPQTPEGPENRLSCFSSSSSSSRVSENKQFLLFQLKKNLDFKL